MSQLSADSASQNNYFITSLHESAESADTVPDSAVTAPESVSSGYPDFELTNAADSTDLPYHQLKTREIKHCGISPRIPLFEAGML